MDNRINVLVVEDSYRGLAYKQKDAQTARNAIGNTAPMIKTNETTCKRKRTMSAIEL